MLYCFLVAFWKVVQKEGGINPSIPDTEGVREAREWQWVLSFVIPEDIIKAGGGENQRTKLAAITSKL